MAPLTPQRSQIFSARRNACIFYASEPWTRGQCRDRPGPSFVRVVYFGAPQIVVDPFRGGISGTTRVQVLNAMDLAVTHQSAICVGSA